jgi:hypothetical protein
MAEGNGCHPSPQKRKTLIVQCDFDKVIDVAWKNYVF